MISMATQAGNSGKFNVMIVGQHGRLMYEAILFAASLRHSDPGFSGRLIIAEPQQGPPWDNNPTIHNDAVRTLLTDEFNAEILPFETLHFGQSYPYGNKIEVRESGQWVVRDYVDGDFVKDDLYDYASNSESGRVVRYYMVCSDERRWDDFFCQIWDRGTNATEIMRNWIKDQHRKYFFTNFKRDRVNFGNFSNYYIRKWFYDYMMYAKAFAQITVHGRRHTDDDERG